MKPSNQPSGSAKGLSSVSKMSSRIQAFRARLFLTHVEEAKDWMERMIGREIPIPEPSKDSPSEFDFLDVLKTSEHLALVGNVVRSLLPPPDNRRSRIHEHIPIHAVCRPRGEVDPLTFGRCMDNFQIFQAACIAAGLPSHTLCTFEDLYERRNVTAVIRVVHALAHLLQRRRLLTSGSQIRDFVSTATATETVKERIQFSPAQIDKIQEDFARVEESGLRLCLDFGVDEGVIKEEEGEMVESSTPLRFADEDLGSSVLVRDQKAAVRICSETSEPVTAVLCVEDDVFEDLPVEARSPGLFLVSFSLSDDDIPDDVNRVRLVVKRGTDFVQRDYEVHHAVEWVAEARLMKYLARGVRTRLGFFDNRWKGEGVAGGDVEIPDLAVFILGDDGAVVGSVEHDLSFEDSRHEGVVETTSTQLDVGAKISVCLGISGPDVVLTAHTLEICRSLAWDSSSVGDAPDVVVGGQTVELQFVDHRIDGAALVAEMVGDDGKSLDSFDLHIERSERGGRLLFTCPMDVDARQAQVRLYDPSNLDDQLQRSYLLIPPIEFSHSDPLPNSLLKGVTEKLPYSDSRSIGPLRSPLRGVLVLPDGTPVHDVVTVSSGDYSGEITVTCPVTLLDVDRLNLRVYEEGHSHEEFLLQRDFSVVEPVVLERPEGGLPPVLTSDETYVVRIFDNRGLGAPELSALAEVGEEMILCDVRDVDGHDNLKEIEFVAEGSGILSLDIFASLEEAEDGFDLEGDVEALETEGTHIHISRPIQAQFGLDPDSMSHACIVDRPFSFVVHDRGDATTPKSAVVHYCEGSEDVADVSTTGASHTISFTPTRLGELQVILRDLGTFVNLVGVELECVPVLELLDADALDSLLALVPKTLRVRDHRCPPGSPAGVADFICCYQKKGSKPRACPVKGLGDGLFAIRLLIPSSEMHTLVLLDKQSKTPLVRRELLPLPAIEVLRDLPEVLVSGSQYSLAVRDLRPKRTELAAKVTSVDLLDDVELQCESRVHEQDISFSFEALGRGPFRLVIADSSSAESKILVRREFVIRPELEFVDAQSIPRLCLLGKTYVVSVRDNRDSLRQESRPLRSFLLQSGKEVDQSSATIEGAPEKDGWKLLTFCCAVRGSVELRVVECLPGSSISAPMLSKALIVSPPVQLVSHFPEQVFAGHGHQYMLTFLDARPPGSELLSSELFLDSRKVHPCCSFVEEGQVRNKFSLYFTCPTAGDAEIRLVGEAGVVLYRHPFEAEREPDEDPNLKVEFVTASQNNIEIMTQGVNEPKYVALVFRSEEDFDEAHRRHILETFKEYLNRVCATENFRLFCEDGSPASLLDIVRPSNVVKDDEILRGFEDHMNAHFRFRVIANGVQNIVISDRPIRVEEWRTEDQDLLMPSIRSPLRRPKASTGSTNSSKLFGALFVSNPNQQGVHRRLFNWNFWVQLFQKVAAAKTSQHEFLDETSCIMRHLTNEIDLRVYRHPDAMLGARKADLLAFGNLILETAQHMIFTIIREASSLEPSLQATMTPMCKGLFSMLQESYEAYRFTLERTLYLNARTMLTEVPDSEKAKVCDLVESFTTEFLVLMKTINAEVAKVVSPAQMATKVTLRMTLKELAVAFGKVRATVLSLRERKILVQELMMRNPPQSPTPTSTSFAISIPLNRAFDKQMFSSGTNSCSDDDPASGLRNPWKCAYVRGSNVAFECLRSASIRCEEFPKTEDNAVALLRVLAANHCQRFARAELIAMRTRGQPLQVPVVVLSVMTPFYLNREDRDVVEMQEALIRQARAVTQVTADLHDQHAPISVKVEFQGPFLLNIGTNATLKTFQMGIGIQRMLNFRRFGIRSFEICVQDYIRDLRVRRFELRSSLESWLEKNLFQTARDGAIYRSSLSQRLHALNSAHIVMQQLESELASRLEIEEKKLSELQTKLEQQMHEHWFPNLATPTKLEYRFRTSGLKATVKALLRTYNRIYRLEQEYFEKWKNEHTWEVQFLKELDTIFSRSLQPPPFYKEYSDLGVLSSDLTALFADLRFLFWKRKHESFTVSLLERSQVQQYDPYDIPVRIVLLAFKLGYQVHVCSRKGGMRVSEVINQALEYTEMRWNFGTFPTVLESTELFHNFRKKIHACLALNGNNMDLQRLNYGVFGTSSDGATAGRFGDPTLYRKYLGFGYLKGTRFASRADAFRRFKELYARGRSALSGQ